MPEWHAPFHGPNVPTEEFLKRRDDYVEKYGYRYSIPGFDDVIHLPFEKSITHAEEVLWRKKKYSDLGPGRFEEIRYMKAQRKKRYLDMLGSPQPEIFQARGSLLGAIDDCQDAMSTLIVLGTVVAKALPRALGKVLMGPISWLMSAANLLDMSMSILTPEMRLVSQKRLHDAVTEDNPFSKKARAKNVRRLESGGFGFGKVLEIAQVTKDIFGIGINLGALMNLPLDIVTGAARAALGKSVTVKYPVPDFSIWMRRLLKAAKGLVVGAGYAPNPNHQEWSQFLILHNLIGQFSSPETVGFDPFTAIDEPAHVEIEAPRPTNFLTLQVIDEIDPGGREAIMWPHTGKRWSTTNDIALASSPAISNAFQAYCHDNKRNWTGFVSATNATQGTFYALENALGRDSIEYDYTASCKTNHALLDSNLHFPQDLTPSQRARFISWMEEHDAQGSVPTLPEVVFFARAVCGFNFFVGPFPSQTKFKAFGKQQPVEYAGIFAKPKTETFPTVPRAFLEKWEKFAYSPKPKTKST